MSILAIFPLLFSSASFAQQEQNWVKLAQVGSSLYDLSCVEFVDSLHGCLGGGSIVMAYTSDGGVSWQQAEGLLFFPQAIAMHDSLVGWAACTASSVEGAIAKTTDGGRSWVQDQAMINRPLWGVATPSPTHCIAVGDTLSLPHVGVILSTTDGGASWKETRTADTVQGLVQVQFTDSLHGWIVRNYLGQGGILKTVDGGRTWTFYMTPQDFYRVSFLDSLNGFGVGAVTANLYRTTDGGRTWLFRSQIDTYNDPEAWALSFVDTTNGWFFSIIFYQGDLSEAIYRTRDGGRSWQQESVGLTRYINGAQMLDTLHGWAVCDGGVVLGYRPTPTSVKDPNGNALATSFQLYQNYPNPFNSSTVIEYQLAREGEVTLTISDLLGRTIATLVHKHQAAGFYRSSWEATGGVGSGMYFYTLTIQGGRRETKRLILLK